MADGLFGMTPDMLQQQRAALLDKEAMQFAQMDPFQRANFGIYRGAAQLGGAIGGMLGGTDPELERVTQLQSLLRGADLSSSEKMHSVAQEAMRIDPRVGMGLFQEAQKTAVQEATIAAKTAEKLTPAQRNAAAAAALDTKIKEYEQLPQSAARDSLIESLRTQREIIAPPKDPVSDIAVAREKARLSVDIARLERISPEARTEEQTALLEKSKLEHKHLVMKKDMAYGANVEAQSKAAYDRNFEELTPEQRTNVLRLINEQELKRAERNRTSVEIKTSDTTGAITAVRGTMSPIRDQLSIVSNALSQLMLDNPKAEAQADRMIATLAGDKQLSMAEVRAVAGAGSLVQKAGDVLNYLFTGQSSALSKQQKIEVVRAVEALLAKKHAATREELGEAYRSHFKDPRQREAVLGPKYTPSTVLENAPTTSPTTAAPTQGGAKFLGFKKND